MAEKELLFYLSHGHGTGNDRGAVSGKFVELELNKEVCKYAREYILEHRGKLKFKVAYPERTGKALTLAGHLADIVSYRLRYRTVFVDVHFNAGGGKGVEVFAKPKNKYATELAEYIIEEQVEIGRPSRGVKYNSNYIIMKAGGVVVLPELGFVDNKTDRKDFDTKAELKEIGYALGKALVRYAEVYA